ncbi:MAG: STAS domain-containing protein [Chloroflexota bacterium]|nr:MAG: STAS domain-containing protein [Chloroflexota bacterium]
MKRIDVGNQVAIITLDRKLTSEHEKELLDISVSPAYGIQRALILDFSGVALLDNTGINALVKLHAATTRTGTRLLATGLSKTYRDVFAVTGLDGGFHVCTSKAEFNRALGFIGGAAAKTIGNRLTTKGSTKTIDAKCWASPVKRLKTGKFKGDPINLNVDGRRTAGPIQGFGQLWEKTYRLDLSNTKLKPTRLVSIMKSNFPKFQPPENRFFPSAKGIKPGEIILINADTPGGLVVTGVLVLYVGKDTFTFITPEGHPEAGWVTFKALQEKRRVIFQIQGLARASDFVYEIAFRMAGSNLQRQIWTHVLKSFARYTGSSARVQFSMQCLDTSLHIFNSFNVFRNAQILSMLHSLLNPRRNSKQAKKRKA